MHCGKPFHQHTGLTCQTLDLDDDEDKEATKMDLVHAIMEAVEALAGPVGEQSWIEFVHFTDCILQMPSELWQHW